MQPTKIKTIIIIALVSIVALLSTCEFAKTIPSEKVETYDSLFYQQWRAENKQKLELIQTYEAKIQVLQVQNDSLAISLKKSKTKILIDRAKRDLIQQRVQDVIKNVDSTETLAVDAIAPLLDSLIFTQQVSDSSCDDTIDLLQITVANRDTTIAMQNRIAESLRDLNKESELRNQYLTEQLNIAFKSQRKKARQNKILAGGLLILSGITTSILITHSLK